MHINLNLDNAIEAKQAYSQAFELGVQDATNGISPKSGKELLKPLHIHHYRRAHLRFLKSAYEAGRFSRRHTMIDLDKPTSRDFSSEALELRSGTEAYCVPTECFETLLYRDVNPTGYSSGVGYRIQVGDGFRKMDASYFWGKDRLADIATRHQAHAERIRQSPLRPLQRNRQSDSLDLFDLEELAYCVCYPADLLINQSVVPILDRVTDHRGFQSRIGYLIVLNNRPTWLDSTYFYSKEECLALASPTEREIFEALFA
jgi:hypothetical protein